MILSERKAEPIVKKLLEYASEAIQEKTGVRIDWQNLGLELSDDEWIFGVNIDDEENYLDITQLMQQLDHIIKRHTRYARQEREEY